MKFIVDDMPYWADDCPFHVNSGCTLQHGATCHYLNPWYKDTGDRGPCPCLKTIEEVQYEQRTAAQGKEG